MEDKYIECKTCGGVGTVECGHASHHIDTKSACTECDDGELTCPDCEGFGHEITTCPKCKGSSKEHCENCDGDGVIPVMKNDISSYRNKKYVYKLLKIIADGCHGISCSECIVSKEGTPCSSTYQGRIESAKKMLKKIITPDHRIEKWINNTLRDDKCDEKICGPTCPVNIVGGVFHCNSETLRPSMDVRLKPLKNIWMTVLGEGRRTSESGYNPEAYGTPMEEGSNRILLHKEFIYHCIYPDRKYIDKYLWEGIEAGVYYDKHYKEAYIGNRRKIFRGNSMIKIFFRGTHPYQEKVINMYKQSRKVREMATAPSSFYNEHKEVIQVLQKVKDGKNVCDIATCRVCHIAVGGCEGTMEKLRTFKGRYTAWCRGVVKSGDYSAAYKISKAHGSVPIREVTKGVTRLYEELTGKKVNLETEKNASDKPISELERKVIGTLSAFRTKITRKHPMGMRCAGEYHCRTCRTLKIKCKKTSPSVHHYSSVSAAYFGFLDFLKQSHTGSSYARAHLAAILDMTIEDIRKELPELLSKRPGILKGHIDKVMIPPAERYANFSTQAMEAGHVTGGGQAGEMLIQTELTPEIVAIDIESCGFPRGFVTPTEEPAEKITFKVADIVPENVTIPDIASYGDDTDVGEIDLQDVVGTVLDQLSKGYKDKLNEEESEEENYTKEDF